MLQIWKIELRQIMKTSSVEDLLPLFKANLKKNEHQREIPPFKEETSTITDYDILEYFRLKTEKGQQSTTTADDKFIKHVFDTIIFPNVDPEKFKQSGKYVSFPLFNFYNYVMRPIIMFTFSLPNETCTITIELFYDLYTTNRSEIIKFYQYYKENGSGITVDYIKSNYLIGIGTNKYNPQIEKRLAFKQEEFPFKHTKGGIVSLPSKKENDYKTSYGFIITIAPCPWLDTQDNKYVVIGQIIDVRYETKRQKARWDAFMKQIDDIKENSKDTEQKKEISTDTADKYKMNFKNQRDAEMILSTKSFEALHEIEKYGTPSGKPSTNIVIKDVKCKGFEENLMIDTDPDIAYQSFKKLPVCRLSTNFDEFELMENIDKIQI